MLRESTKSQAFRLEVIAHFISQHCGLVTCWVDLLTLKLVHSWHEKSSRLFWTFPVLSFSNKLQAGDAEKDAIWACIAVSWKRVVQKVATTVVYWTLALELESISLADDVASAAAALPGRHDNCVVAAAL